MALSGGAVEAIAAESALGTLRGGARRRFAELARSDAAIGAIARRWDEALAPLAADVRPGEPPARVWRAIESRLRPSRPQAVSAWGAPRLVGAGVARGGPPPPLLVAAAPPGAPPLLAGRRAPRPAP